MLQPDVDTPFVDHVDVMRRLLPYHIYQQPREDLELIHGRKGKQRAANSDPKTELKGEYLIFPSRGLKALSLA